MPWYDIVDPHDPRLDELAQEFHLHSLHIEDCRSANERPKAECTHHYLFVILKTLDFSGDEIQFPTVYMFIGSEFFITVDSTPSADATALQPVRRANPEEKPGKLFYLVFDHVVDGYFNAIDKFSDHIDELQDRVLDSPNPSVLQEIFGHKRNLAEARRLLVNTRDVCICVQRESEALIGDELRPFFRDVYDHIIRNLDSVETERDLLTNTLDVYLSSVANRTNEVMRVLTVVSTIALPCLLISSIYGMNIKGIPFLESPYGMLFVTAAMVLTTGVLLAVLKKSGWL